MNKSILRKAGFNEAIELSEKGKCPFCKKEVDLDGFKDELSKKEYEISGLCQVCQDETF